MIDVVLPGCASDASLRGASFCSESECFFYRERGEMDVVFRNELWGQSIKRWKGGEITG